MAMRLQHPCHREHPLILRELSENCSILCTMCDLFFNGPTYCCWDCSIFLHKSCAELPLKTEHPAHPEHPTLSLESTLAITDRDGVKYSGCGREVFHYRCDDCSFRLDMSLVAITLYQLKEEEEEKEMIQHFAHDHPLTPFKLDMPVNVECRACRRLVSGPIYGCHACSFYLHEWCAQLPREKSQHPFHPQHHLSLFPKADDKCNVCLSRPGPIKYDLDFYVYKCNECQFNIDVLCASFEPFENQQEDCGPIKHDSHQHQLASFSMKAKEIRYVWCQACWQSISGEVYGCVDCKFFLHKSCPPAQPKDRLVTAKHQPHAHDLDYFNTGLDLDCNFCGEKCRADSYSCFKCCFFVHYNCIRTLPLSIEHDCHFHPLVLRDEFVQYHDEQYCDACEKTRRPDHSVYYCAECNFSAHIGCVIPGVKIEETKPVKLKKVEGKISSIKVEIEEVESDIAEKQKKLEALNVKLKALMVKRDYLI